MTWAGTTGKAGTQLQDGSAEVTDERVHISAFKAARHTADHEEPERRETHLAH